MFDPWRLIASPHASIPTSSRAEKQETETIIRIYYNYDTSYVVLHNYCTGRCSDVNLLIIVEF